MADLTLDPNADDQKLLAQVVDFYYRTLKETTEALAYLRSRGITDSEAIDRFHIGYANRTLGLTLPSIDSKAGQKLRAKLQRVGLFRDSGHEQMNGCVTFPITACGEHGKIVDLYGRKTGNHLRKGTPLHMHLGEQARGVWNLDAVQSTEEVILCPSLWDALAFWCASYRNVTCTFGPDALTEDHLAAFHAGNVRRVLLASEAVAGPLMAAGFDCYLLALPMGLDANRYALQATDPREPLGESIRKAAWLGKGPTMAVVGAEVLQAAEDGKEPGDNIGDQDDTSANPFDGLDEEDMDGDLPQVNPAVTAPSASQVPPVPQKIEVEHNGDEIILRVGDRRYRVRGLSKCLAFDQLKVNLLVSTERGMFVDTFDLYSARHRRQFVVQAAVELGVEERIVNSDLGRVLLKLEELQEGLIAKTLEPKPPEPTMTPDEREAALGLLHDPALLERIVADFDVVGERTNKLIGYLAAVSRKLDQPLAVIIQSSSAAGKTSLMDGILAFVPPEDQVKYSAMTGQSLFYMGESNLKHKILAIVEEEGAERASYALKLLQSEGALTIASTGKDASTGRMVTQQYTVEGPVMLFLTTTAIKIDEELLNRCLVLSVDEDREQTRAIHQHQRRRQTLAGLLADHDRRETVLLHRNAQRLLLPVLVANPYAEHLTFLDDRTRTRRDHLKYLTLIRAVALLHQYQRPVKTVEHQGRTLEYIEVTPDDIAVANRLACEVLGRSADELPPQTRRLLTLVDEMVSTECDRLGIDRAEYRFSRREVRQYTGWGHTQLKVHLKRLEELEYLLVHRGGRGQAFAYELVYDPPPEPGTKFLARLIDVDDLRRQYDGHWSGANGQKSGRGRVQVGVKSGRSRPPEIDASTDRTTAMPVSKPEVSENAHLDPENLVAS